MGSREAILDAIRRNRPSVSAPLPDLADPGGVGVDRPNSLSAGFTDALAVLGGRAIVPEADETIANILATLFPGASLCSATPEVAGTHPLPPVDRPGDLATIDIGIVRAAFGVAETGSVFLSEAELGVNAIGYLVQHLVVLLDPADLVESLDAAYARPEFATAGYAVLMTGPSATADIEGVLIRGAQGVRSLTAILLPRTG